jgi:hypothetical protein
VAGAAVTAAALWYLWAARDAPDDLAKPLIVYAAVTCAMISLGRARLYAELMPGIFGDGRYVIFSAAIVAVLLHRIIIRARPDVAWEARGVAVLSVAVISISAASYYLLGDALARSSANRIAKFDMWASGKIPEFDPRPENETIIRDAVCGGYFRRDLAASLCGGDPGASGG